MKWLEFFSTCQFVFKKDLYKSNKFPPCPPHMGISYIFRYILAILTKFEIFPTFHSLKWLEFFSVCELVSRKICTSQIRSTPHHMAVRILGISYIFKYWFTIWTNYKIFITFHALKWFEFFSVTSLFSRMSFKCQICSASFQMKLPISRISNNIFLL